MAQEFLEKALPIVKKNHGKLAVNKVSTLLPAKFHPELDQSPILSPDKTALVPSAGWWNLVALT